MTRRRWRWRRAAGPTVFVANHPYGVLDGIVISWLVEKVRPDFLVLTNAVLMRAEEVRDYVLPIDFSDTPEARAMNVRSRAAARAQLEKGGAVVVFPAGGVSTAPDRLGRLPAVDAPWQPFVAQLVQRAKATVVPIWFGGQNSRLFQIASHVSLTLRLSLLFHEVKTRIGASLPVAIGAPIPYPEIADIRDRQALADLLMARTYALAIDPRRPSPAEGPRRQIARQAPAIAPTPRCLSDDQPSADSSRRLLAERRIFASALNRCLRSAAVRSAVTLFLHRLSLRLDRLAQIAPRIGQPEPDEPIVLIVPAAGKQSGYGHPVGHFHDSRRRDVHRGGDLAGRAAVPLPKRGEQVVLSEMQAMTPHGLLRQGPERLGGLAMQVEEFGHRGLPA